MKKSICNSILNRNVKSNHCNLAANFHSLLMNYLNKQSVDWVITKTTQRKEMRYHQHTHHKEKMCSTSQTAVGAHPDVRGFCASGA